MPSPMKLGVALAVYAAAATTALVLRFSPWLLVVAIAVPVVGLLLVALIDIRVLSRKIGRLIAQLADDQARARWLTERLDRAEHQLRALDEPVLVIDERGAIAACNPAAESLLELRAERLLGRPPEEAFTRTDLLGLFQRAREGRHVREQVRITRAGGVGVWDVSAIPLHAAAGGSAGVLMCLRDVTEGAIALRARTDFAANASHELRTPIAAMRVALDTLGALGEGDGAMRERLDRVIATNVARLEELARDLLDLSRMESTDEGIEARWVDIGELTQDLRAAYEPVAESRRITLVFDVEEGLTRLRSDKGLLELILGNLIDNSAKYAFEGTEVRVVARRLAGADGAAPGVRLEVIDRGVGIPMDQQQRVFERFYQVDAARTPGQPRRGTGLGLAIVKHAVKRLGGNVKVQSVWQQGTTMIVELPDCLEP